MLGMLFILSLLSNVISSDFLYGILRIIGIFSLAIPPYITARTAAKQPILHSLIIGFIQALLIVLLMTQTSSWESTMQNSIAGRIPLVVGAMLLLSLLTGIFARWMNQKSQS